MVLGRRIMSVAAIHLWGRTIGAVSWNERKKIAFFEYTPAFLKSGIELSPLMMPLAPGVFSFPSLSRQTFHGLPGLLADALPDKFGNMLINQWLANQGRKPESFNPVERLCYIGKRGIGALEFEPTQGPKYSTSRKLQMNDLVALASEILTHRTQLKTSFSELKRERALKDILQVGTSAGGARAKAVIAWNSKTNEVRSGQVDSEDGFSYWIIKFDGVSGNKDKELDDPKGYGLIEYAYHLMAKDAGIKMMESRILTEGGRAHFMTKRFDRDIYNKKLHMQSLCGLAHYDYNQAGAYSYEQSLQVIRQLGMPMASLEEQYRRMAFNVIARNQDDHVKNIAFLMNKQGEWSLAPAFDVTYSYNPSGSWTANHQMTLNGKRDNFTMVDFVACAKSSMMKRGRAQTIMNEVENAVKRWPEFAAQAQVANKASRQIQETHRLTFSAR